MIWLDYGLWHKAGEVGLIQDNHLVYCLRNGIIDNTVEFAGNYFKEIKR